MGAVVAKRVFILGAGFSKPAGFPLATELTDAVLDVLRQAIDERYELFDFANHVRKLHQWIARSKTLPKLNIEEFYEYLTIYRERFMFEQHMEPVGRTAGDTAYGQAESIEAWLSHLDEYLLVALLNYEDAAMLGPIKRFTGTLRPGDSVVTFNYDRLVERCLSASKVPWTFGMEEKPTADAIPILKMHGSLDWVCFARDQRCDRNGFRLIFSKKDSNREREVRCDRSNRSEEHEYEFELFHVHDDETLHKFLKMRDLIQVDCSWGLAGLGRRKRVSLVPGLGVVWDRARRALYHADEVVILGFSFSGYDRLAQVEFASVMAARHENGVIPPRIVVVDPALRRRPRMSASGRMLKQRVEAVFRPANLVGECHEQFNWATLP